MCVALLQHLDVCYSLLYQSQYFRFLGLSSGVVVVVIIIIIIIIIIIRIGKYIGGDRTVIKKAEKILKYKDLTRKP